MDVMHSALGELFFIEHPEVSKSAADTSVVESFIREHTDAGVWVYYPWRDVAVHTPSDALYHRLRTARNRNLITPTEQERYRAATVGIAGLSVGSAALGALVATGGPQHIKIADPDILEITNLNRIRATLLDVGESKVTIAARAAWEVDPFITLEQWPAGVTHDTLQQFMGSPRLDVFVDEMDDIKMKLRSRVVCQELGIPVVMVTDNGDSIIIDVERFDQEPGRPIFHGRVHFAEAELEHITREKFIAMANEIIDPKYFTMRQWDSITQIGKTLSGVPQLGTAAVMAGAAVAYVVRRITNDLPMPSGRYVMGLESAFTPV